MADQRWSDIYVVFTKILCGRNFCLVSYKAKIHRTASNGFTESNLMSNRKVIELLLQLKSAKAHGKNDMKVKPHLVRHLLRNCLLIPSELAFFWKFFWGVYCYGNLRSLG